MNAKSLELLTDWLIGWLADWLIGIISNYNKISTTSETIQIDNTRPHTANLMFKLKQTLELTLKIQR